jgi:hypothetical protein
VITVFAVVNAALLRPLPYDHHERLVSLSLSNSRVPGQGLFSLIRVDQLRAKAVIFSCRRLLLAHLQSYRPDQPEQLAAAGVSHDFLQTLGYTTDPRARTFLPEEDRDGGRPVVLLSCGL